MKLLDADTDSSATTIAALNDQHAQISQAHRTRAMAEPHTEDAFARMFEGSHHAVLRVEADGRLVRANARGIQALAQARLLHLDNGRVQPVKSSYLAAWRRNLQIAVSGEPGLAFIGDGRKEMAIAIGRDNSRGDLADISRDGFPSSTGRPAPTLLVIMGADSPCDDRALTHYADNHQLTPAEQRVLVELLKGLAPCEIAYEFDIAENTVRSQIKSVLAKTGNHSIRNLLLSISRLPPVSFLDDHGSRATSPAGGV